nr:beta-propeller fold lactonase family protein [Pectobacterium sp. PL152]
MSLPNSGSAVLSVFVRNTEGKFTLSKILPHYREVFNNDTLQNDRFIDNPSLAGASEVTLSSDGQYLYVVGSEGNTVTLFRVGSGGELTQAGVLDSAALGAFAGCAFPHCFAGRLSLYNGGTAEWRE